MEFNIADLIECVADAVPAREAVVCGDDRRTYAELDERATRLAHALRSARRAASAITSGSTSATRSSTSR